MGNLRVFLNASENSVTRERLFFNRFYYDLKLAAAHRGIALTVYEPEVDRDGFDVVIDDGDVTRFVQLKTVLKTSPTSLWRTRKRFLRPDRTLAEPQGIGGADSGKGGAVVLIEIDASQYNPPVTYHVTDYSVLRILSSVLGRGTKHGPDRLLGARRTLAFRTWMELHRGSPDDKITLTKQQFLKARDAAGVLALLDLHSEYDCYLPGTSLIMAEREGFRVEDDGFIDASAMSGIAKAHARRCGESVLEVADEPALRLHPNLS